MEIKTKVYKDIVSGVLDDYKKGYNEKFPRETLDYEVTLTEQEVDMNKVLKSLGSKLDTEEVKNIKAKYLRVEEVVTRIDYRIPLIDEFIPAFKYQELNEDKKVWEVKTHTNTSKEYLQELLDKKHIRVEQFHPPRRTLLLSQSYLIQDPDTLEIIPDKELENRIYKDLLYNLIIAGIEYNALIALERKKQQERESLKGNKPDIEVKQNLPEELSDDDKKYVEWVKKEKLKS